MNLTDIPLMAMLKGKMAYISARQSVIAQNVANADTPGYLPRDLKAFDFDRTIGGPGMGAAAGLTPPSASSPGTASVEAISEVRTNAMHLQTDPPKAQTFGDQYVADSEARLDGNQVVLEDQMVKLTSARLDYDAAVGFYQKSLGLLQLAIKKPGA